MNMLSTDIIFHITNYLSDEESIKYLRVNKYYQKLITKYVGKNFYTYGDLGKYKFKIVKVILSDIEKLPDYITHVKFSDYFDKEIKSWPKNITHLIFNRYFNRSVDNLPKNLTHLTFGYNFNQSVDNIPKNLTHLKINL